MELRYLSSEDVESAGISPEECIELVRHTLEQHATQELEMPPKSGIHPPAGRHIHAMSAFLPDLNAAGLKWIADFPCNRNKGWPTLSSLIILNDAETGVPVCVMDGALVTSMRTAAMTAISLQECARADATQMAIIGTGVQARAHVRVLQAALPGLHTIRVAGREPGHAVRFCAQTQGNGLLPARTSEEAVCQADVVVTLTNSVHAPLLDPGWLKPGVTVAVLDNGGKETGILPVMDRIFTDDRRGFQNDEVQHRFPTGIPQLDGEIGEILLRKIAGRRNQSERILILNLGIAASDIAVASRVHRRSLELRRGIILRR